MARTGWLPFVVLIIAVGGFLLFKNNKNLKEGFALIHGTHYRNDAMGTNICLLRSGNSVLQGLVTGSTSVTLACPAPAFGNRQIRNNQCSGSFTSGTQPCAEVAKEPILNTDNWNNRYQIELKNCTSLEQQSTYAGTSTPAYIDNWGRPNCVCPSGFVNHQTTRGWCVKNDINCLPGRGLGLTSTDYNLCTVCTGNKISPGGNSVYCSECPANSQPNATRTECVCLAGTVGTPQTGCIQCQPGQFAASGATTCSDCAPGTFSTTTGASSCTTCGANQYQDQTRQSSCKSLPANSVATADRRTFTCNNGYQKNSAQNACEMCGVDSYGTGGTCTFCPTGKTSPAPTATSLNTSVNQCTVRPGFYGTAGTSDATPCPPNSTCAAGGTAASTAGLTTFTCKDGFKKTADGLGCEPCDVGTYGTGGSCSSTCSTKAASGTTQTWTTNGTGKSSEADCTVSASCTTGNYVNNGSCIACSGITGAATYTSDGRISTSCSLNECGANFYKSGNTCASCPPTRTSPQGSTSESQCACPPGSILVKDRTNNDICVQDCGAQFPPKSKGSRNNFLVDGYDCSTKQYTFKNPDGTTTNTNPCTGQSFYNFDTQKCETDRGEVVSETEIRCSPETVYDVRTNACVPVTLVATPDKLVGTVGQPGIGDFNDCKTTDRGDCTLLYTNLTNPTFTTKTTTNPCIASGRLYDFRTKQCVNPNDPCCSETDPNVLATRTACRSFVTELPRQRNPNKCRTIASNRCCLPIMAGNSTCLNQGFWERPRYTFSSLKATKCSTAGFEDYKSELDTIAMKKAKRLQRAF